MPLPQRRRTGQAPPVNRGRSRNTAGGFDRAVIPLLSLSRAACQRFHTARFAAARKTPCLSRSIRAFRYRSPAHDAESRVTCRSPPHLPQLTGSVSASMKRVACLPQRGSGHVRRECLESLWCQSGTGANPGGGLVAVWRADGSAPVPQGPEISGNSS
jgi:hypothetical protein